LRTFSRYFAGILTVILLSAVVVCAQVERGRLAGTVTDQSGAVVTGATITVTNLGTNAVRNTRTSGTGAYSMVGLEPATYQVTVASGDFKPFNAKVEVTVGGHVTLDAKLSISASTSNVQVIGEGGTVVNTQTQELSQVVDQQQLAQLPSLTRNPYDFVAVSGNVSSGDNTTTSGASGQNLTGRGVGYSINGQRESGTEILLDGVENINNWTVGVGEEIPIDAVQEYSVITNNYTAEYGRASGGVVNVTTKPGTDNFHGSAWEFNRLSAYTANTYANDAANAAAGSIVAPKGNYTRNQFGFQAGGPILKNKLFISESTEWTRVRSAALESQEILDPSFIAMLPANARAYFAAFGTGALPASGKVTTAGQLNVAGYPVGPINGVTAVPSSQPVFDVVNFKTNFDAGGDVPQNTYRLVGRLDFNPTDKTQMFFRAGRENLDSFTGSSFYSAYPQFDVGFAALNQSYLYSLAHTFNSNLFGSAKVSLTRFNNAKTFDASLVSTPNLIFTPAIDPATLGAIQLPGLENGSGSGGLPSSGPQNTLQFEPDLAWTKGKHLMRFGGLFTYTQMNLREGVYAQAQEQLGWTVQDSMNDLLNVAGNAGGSQLVSFEAGVNPQGKLPCVANPGFWLSGSTSDLNTTPNCAVTPPLSAPAYGRSYRTKDWAAYAEDNFRLLPRLTIDYGLRYEHYGVQHNNNQNLDSNFYLGSGSSFEEQLRNGGVQIAGKSSTGQFWKPSWGTLAPRIGFAYDVFGNGKTSLRSGYGISYERDFSNITYGASFNPPASAVVTSACAPSVTTCTALVTNNNLGVLGVAGPSSYLAPVTLTMLNPDMKVAQTQFWSLSLQQEVARNTVVELSYSGARGVHLYDIEEVNNLGAGQFYLGDPLSFSNSPNCPAPCLNRPNNQYSVIWMQGSAGSSSYQAFNAKLQAQNLHNTGLSLVANYTWSHSLDDLSSSFSTDSLQGKNIGSYGYTNFLNPKLDWGNSDFDLRQRFVVSPIWETPWFKAGTGSFAEREALGGWTFSGIFTARTGTPFSVFDFTNVYNQDLIPRLTPATPIRSYHVGSPQRVGPNSFNALTLPVPASFAPLDPALGISDFGPFPSNMTHRNAFGGPGAWNMDMALSKKFKPTERVSVEFRAEGFDILNHHNYYVSSSTLYYEGTTTTPLEVTEQKGGLGSGAMGGNHDERRFGQFSLRASF